jgi:hypothetical protein
VRAPRDPTLRAPDAGLDALPLPAGGEPPLGRDEPPGDPPGVTADPRGRPPGVDAPAAGGELLPAPGSDDPGGGEPGRSTPVVCSM